MARHRPRPATRAARAVGRFGGARLVAGALACCCARVCAALLFGSAQADVRDESSTSCSLLRRCAACCRPLGRLLCAAVLPFWLGASRGPQQEQLELLVALAMRGLLLAPLLAAVRSRTVLFWLDTDQCPRTEKLELLVASAVRGLLLAPWPAAVRSSCTVLARHSPTSVTRAARAAGRFGSAWLAVGVFGRLLCAAVLLFLARRRPRAVT